MEPLFIKKEVSFEKEASYRLGRDISTWEQDIVEKLHEEHPYLPDYDIKVTLRKTDEASGSGIGQIVVDDQIRMPVIIKDYKLLPLDLMYYNDSLLPVTQTSIDNITQDGSFGKAIKPIESGGDMGLRTATQPPHYGKYAYAHLLEHTREDVLTAADSAYSVDGLRYDLADSRLLREGFVAYLENTPITKVAAAPKPTLTLLKEGSLVKVAKGGVRTVGREGIMCKVASFEGGFHPTSLFIATNGTYSYCDNVPGIAAHVKIATAEPKGYGVFVTASDDGYICTEPAKVLYKTAEYVEVLDGLGRHYRVYQMPAFTDGFAKVANKIYMSSNWRFVPVTDACPVSDVATLNKLAAAGADFTVRRIGNHYIVEGNTSAVPEIAKIANSPVTRVELQNGFTAYCSPEDVTAIIAQADKAIAAKIKTYAPDAATGDMVEMPKIAKADLAAFIKSAGILTDSIVKQAGVDEEAAEKTVDVLLGLNFLNKQNIYRMLEGIDDLHVAREVLSRVLLAGRFGLDIDISTVRTAVFALDAVIKDLRRLRQTHLVE